MRGLKIFRSPKFKLETKRVAEIPFQGQVAAGVTLNLASGQITYPFRIIEVKMIFTDEAMNQVFHRWFVGTQGRVNPTGEPAGTNIFGRESPTARFNGRAVIRVVPCNIEFPTGRRYIVLHTDNTSPYQYDFVCSVTVQEL